MSLKGWDLNTTNNQQPTTREEPEGGRGRVASPLLSPLLSPHSAVTAQRRPPQAAPQGPLAQTPTIQSTVALQHWAKPQHAEPLVCPLPKAEQETHRWTRLHHRGGAERPPGHKECVVKGRGRGKAAARHATENGQCFPQGHSTSFGLQHGRMQTSGSRGGTGGAGAGLAQGRGPQAGRQSPLNTTHRCLFCPTPPHTSL